MSQTVIGFFDDQSEAHRAIEQLQSGGFSRQQIDISSSNNSAGTTSNSSATSDNVNPVSGSARDENSVSRTPDDRTVDRDGRNTNKFTDFINNLFGGNSDDDDAGRYSHVAERSKAIVTVHANSEEEAERASEILDDSGAVDVNERASQYGYTSAGQSRGNTGEGSDVPGNTSDRLSSGSGSSSRSRIFNRRLDDSMRMRDLD